MKKLFSIVLCLVCLFSFLSVGSAETAQDPDEFLSELSGEPMSSCSRSLPRTSIIRPGWTW